MQLFQGPDRAQLILTFANADIRETVFQIVEERADELIEAFYAALIEDREATRFLSHKLVNERLQHSLRNWLIDLFSCHTTGDESFLVERQKVIGDVHARIRIPIHLVMQGASLIKIGIVHYLRETTLPRDELWKAILYTGALIDFALQVMSQAFVRSAASRAQTDEAYRLFSLGQDVSLDRESQRAALMEWSQSVLFNLYGAEREAKLAPISTSDFGLWLHHRAGVMFQGSASLENIEKAMQRMDLDLLPRIREARASQPSLLKDLMEEFQASISEMKFLLSDMFQSVAAIENGRDPLTKTLNRRFLPSILSREIAIATKNKMDFAILMLDVDHFKQINDTWGHPAGDAILSQVAEAILDTCRLSDFVFRYGGEEFLIALVETDEDGALQMAERIRTQIELREFTAPDNTPLTITASIGIACYDGHPDFSYLIQAADKALYQAKNGGRNRTAIAKPLNVERAS